LRGKDAVAIMQYVLKPALESDSLELLLQRPGGGWMCGEFAINQSATAVLNDGDCIEQPERGGH